MVLSARVQNKDKVVKFFTASKKAKKTTRRKFRLNGPAVALLLVLGFVFYSFGGQMIELYTVRHEAQKVRDQIENLQRKNVELKKKVEYLESDTYIERMAREKLSLVRPGEKIILEAKPGAKTSNPKQVPQKRRQTELH